MSAKKPVVVESYDEIVFSEPSEGFFARVQNHPAVIVPRLPAGFSLPPPGMFLSCIFYRFCSLIFFTRKICFGCCSTSGGCKWKEEVWLKRQSSKPVVQEFFRSRWTTTTCSSSAAGQHEWVVFHLHLLVLQFMWELWIMFMIHPPKWEHIHSTSFQTWRGIYLHQDVIVWII